MARVLPSSLSPHVTTVLSPDLIELFTRSSLPPLHHILQSYSPLPQVTTRTTNLQPVHHQAFTLRFSNLEYIEAACKEDEETRSSRFIDWLGARIARRSARWVEELEELEHGLDHLQETLTKHSANGELDPNERAKAVRKSFEIEDQRKKIKTPWWDEMVRCVEGEWAPSRSEGWNHPVSIIYAISTTAPNPLQAISNLWARPIELPNWVEPSVLRYILIVHPERISPLNTDECIALFNAVKKQYGLHIHVLNLKLEQSPTPIPIIPLPPQLPPFSVPPPPRSAPQPSSGIMSPHANLASPGALTTPQSADLLLPELNGRIPRAVIPDTSELLMSEADAQSTGKFIREFLTQSLIPWMEKCVLEWNEAYSNKSRLQSRLFSSTRRLFGGSTTSATPAPAATSGSPVGYYSNSYTGTGSVSPISPHGATFSAPPPPQHRRLAEFATFLGDYRLAVQVWESLRKEGKGGSAILPLLLAPSPTLVGYAMQALAPVMTPEPTASAMFNAILCAVRWETGLSDLLSLDGERWLVWAAATAEEASTALLLGHAAHLSRQKGTKRRAALWYVMAAHKLEKCGIKPLTAHFLREAHSMCSAPVPKSLSPSFSDAEAWPDKSKDGVSPIVMTNLEHFLGRMKYTLGDTKGAVQLFLGLLRYSLQMDSRETDVVVIDDIRQSLEHLEHTRPEVEKQHEFKLPINFCVAAESKIRIGHQNEQVIDPNDPVWEKLESVWAASREKGKGKLEQPRAEVGEPFWVNLVLANPIDAIIQLRNFTLTLTDPHDATQGHNQLARCEVLDEIELHPNEKRIIPITVTPLETRTLSVVDARYHFISQLPIKEDLHIRGGRLNNTVAEKRGVVYSPSTTMNVAVKKDGCIMDVELIQRGNEYDDDDLVLVQGEIRSMTLRITNRGTTEVKEVWITIDASVTFWIDDNDDGPAHPFFLEELEQAIEEFPIFNHLEDPKPIRISLEKFCGQPTLQPAQYFDVPVFVRPEDNNNTRICALLTYRRDESFFFTRFNRDVNVVPTLFISSSVFPTPSESYQYGLRLEVENTTEELDLEVQQICTLGTEWHLAQLSRSPKTTSIQALQVTKLSLGIAHQPTGAVAELQAYVEQEMSNFLMNRPLSENKSPNVSLRYSHIGRKSSSISSRFIQHFLLSSRRRHHLQTLITTFPNVPLPVLQHLFPLYTPHTLDLIFFWESHSSDRIGFIVYSDLQLGVGHALIRDTLEAAVQMKGKSMYAETQREYSLLLAALADCEWNRETDPLVVRVTASSSVVEHDFSKGPCSIPVEFQLNNYSSTNPLRYVLHLSSPEAAPLTREFFPPTYSGRLTHRGIILPGKHTSARACITVTSPGQYKLSGWQIEVNVGEQMSEDSLSSSGTSTSPWKSRARYLQQPDIMYETILLVRNVSVPS